MARKPLAIDASGVVHLGALGLQVLLAAARDRAAGGLPMRIEAPSAPFLDALAIFGVSLADLTPETRT
jgi:chemotaxis protein CheX